MGRCYIDGSSYLTLVPLSALCFPRYSSGDSSFAFALTCSAASSRILAASTQTLSTNRKSVHMQASMQPRTDASRYREVAAGPRESQSQRCWLCACTAVVQCTLPAHGVSLRANPYDGEEAGGRRLKRLWSDSYTEGGELKGTWLIAGLGMEMSHELSAMLPGPSLFSPAASLPRGGCKPPTTKTNRGIALIYDDVDCISLMGLYPSYEANAMRIVGI